MTRQQIKLWLIVFSMGLLCVTSMPAAAQNDPVPTGEIPADATIVYEAKNEAGDTDIWISTPIGFRNLTALSTANDTSPKLSPDGTKVLYLTENTLNVVGIDGTGFTQITPPGVLAYSAIWTPRGDLIISARWSDDRPQLFVSASASTTLYTLTQPGNVAVEPAWGGGLEGFVYFIYIPQGETTMHIASITPYGGELQLLTSDTTQKTGLSVSPDAEYAFWTFRANENDDTEIASYNFGTGELLQITDNTVNNRAGTLSFDGNTLLYMEEGESGQDNLIQSNLDGTNPVSLTVNSSIVIHTFQPISDDTTLIDYEENGVRKIGFLKSDGTIIYIRDGSHPNVFGDLATRLLEPGTCALRVIADGVLKLAEPSNSSYGEEDALAGELLRADGKITAEGYTWYRLFGDGWIRGDQVEVIGNCDELPEVSL